MPKSRRSIVVEACALACLPSVATLDVEDHRACRPTQRQVAGHLPVVAVGLLDSRGPESDGRAACDVEEVGGAQVSVTLGLVRVDRARVDHRLDRRARQLLVVWYHAAGREPEPGGA